MSDERDPISVMHSGETGAPYAVLENDKGFIVIRSWSQYEYVALHPKHLQAIIKVLWETSGKARDSIRYALQECGASIQPRSPENRR